MLDVAIIGGGIAGLAAAYELHQRGLQARVLEAGPRPGGELWVCPELGMSHAYHVSTNPHPWPDAVRAGRELRAAWRRALARAKGPS